MLIRVTLTFVICWVYILRIIIGYPKSFFPHLNCSNLNFYEIIVGFFIAQFMTMNGYIVISQIFRLWKRFWGS